MRYALFALSAADAHSSRTCAPSGSSPVSSLTANAWAPASAGPSSRIFIRSSPRSQCRTRSFPQTSASLASRPRRGAMPTPYEELLYSAANPAGRFPRLMRGRDYAARDAGASTRPFRSGAAGLDEDAAVVA